MGTNSHKKYINSHGVEVPSVTTIIKLLNKPQLLNWANYLGFKRIQYDKELERTSEIGTFVHSLIEEYNTRLLVDYSKLEDLYSLDSYNCVMNCFNQYKKWRRYNKPEILKSELSITGELYGGTLDNISRIDDIVYLIDFKTSNAVHPTMFIQLAAYVKLLELENIYVDKVGILRLDKKKDKYEFVTMKNGKQLDKYYHIFESLLYVYNEWSYTLKSDWNQRLIL